MEKNKKAKPGKSKSMTAFYRVCHFLLAWIFKLLYLVRVKGKKNEPPKDQNFIVCSNHMSACDPILIGAVLKRHQPYYMAKKELFTVPVLGWMIKSIGAFPVDRQGGNTATVFHTINLLKEGKSIGIFPQGTRCPGKDPTETKVRSGLGMFAVKSEAMILPVFLKTKDNKPKIFRSVTVIIGEPIPFSELNYDPEKPHEYMRISEYVFGKICELGGYEKKEPLPESAPTVIASADDHGNVNTETSGISEAEGTEK